jgi:hypothetical protein
MPWITASLKYICSILLFAVMDNSVTKFPGNQNAIVQ